MFAYMITHHRWVFVVFLLMPLSVVFGESSSASVESASRMLAGHLSKPRLLS